jgi:formate dehydrogenase subunit gamma
MSNSSFDRPRWNDQRAGEVIDHYKTMRGGLLPALHALQSEFGYVDDASMPALAEAFNLSPADVYGVITFYHDFKRSRPGRHTIRVCRAEACQSMGAEELMEHFKKHLDVELGGTSADGQFSLEQVFCLGNCALSPAIMIDQTVYGRVTEGRIDALCKGVRS